MRPLWEELGLTIPPKLQIIEYTLALRLDIQADLEKLLLSIRITLLIIKEQANIIYR
jgi:hypothetical protein